jgi:predicted regulator of Ras-like GTPase activity (Roadblock/LC7/MglB family)
MMDNEFRAALQAICGALPGTVAATLMGSDGIPIETVEGADAELEVSSLIVEYGSLIDQIRRSAQMFEAGGLEELTIASEHITTLIRPLTEEYFLALALGPGVPSGKGRYLMRIHAPGLLEALA